MLKLLKKIFFIITIQSFLITGSDIREYPYRLDFSNAKQSSTAFYGEAFKAQGQKSFPPSWKPTCLSNLYDNVSGEGRNRTYQGYFSGPFILDKFNLTTFKSTVTTVKEVKDSRFWLNSFVVNPVFNKNENKSKLISDCFKWKGHLQDSQNIVLPCDKPLIGLAASVLRENTSDIGNRFPLCGIELFGRKMVNLAQRKLTKQSSRRRVDSNTHVTVNGAYKPHFENPKMCISTTDDDLFPWWRVDLLGIYLVKSLHVHFFYPDELKVIHDLQIRVGEEDINEMPSNRLFNGNTICEDYTGFIISGRILYIPCRSQILGQFVSIQLTKHCNHPKYCADPRINEMNLCQVEVYGYPVEAYYYGNLALTNKFFTNFHDQEADEKFSYWRLELNSLSAIRSVDLFIEKDISKGISFNFQIRIGTEYPIHLWARWSKQNLLCVNENNIKLKRPVYRAHCENIVGNFVTVQHECLKNNVRYLCGQFPFTNILVWGFSLREYLEMIKTEKKKDDNSQRADLEVFDDMAVVKTSRIGNDFDEVFPCSHTNPGAEPFPWWSIKTSRQIKMTAFKIINDDFETQRRLHDVEIRFGEDDIAKYPKNKLFQGNTLCYSSVNKLLPTDGTTLFCKRPIKGRYLSIQIVKKCSNSEICNVWEPNILNICKIEIYNIL